MISSRLNRMLWFGPIMYEFNSFFLFHLLMVFGWTLRIEATSLTVSILSGILFIEYICSCIIFVPYYILMITSNIYQYILKAIGN